MGRHSWTRACVLVATLVCVRPAPAQTVVVLLFDGWTPAMVSTEASPALLALGREGAWTHRVEPVFPTVSLPNHVSLSTGCWPARHGIVSNLFLDPGRGAYDHDVDADWLLGCEHLQEVAERQGVRTAALWWPGARSTVRGPLASTVMAAGQDTVPDRIRGERVVELLRRPAAERPRLILAYFHGPDEAAHYRGIESNEVRQAVQRSDSIVASVLDALRALRAAGEPVTLIVTTDHGMAEIRTIVNVKRILRSARIDARFESSGTTSFLYLTDRSAAAVDRAVTALSRYTQFDVLRRSDIPEAWHLGESDRLGDLVISARPPYFIEDLDTWPRWARWLGTVGPKFIWARPVLKATHGYPADTPDMRALLYAWGDGIAAGDPGPVRTIDVHPTVAAILGIAPGSPVDGAPIAALVPARTR